MSELLLLDVRTLAFASSIGGFLMAATMLGIYLAGMRVRALLTWSGAGLAFGSGYLLGHLLQTVPVPMPLWVGGAIANALIGLGHGLILIGVQRYLGLTPWIRTIMLLVGAMLVSAFIFPELRESLRLRVALHSGWFVLVTAYAAWLLWQARRPGMVVSYRAVAGVLMMFAAFLSLRLGYALISPALTTSFVQDPFQLGTFLAAMIFGFCLTMALAVMMFREKQLELLVLAETDPLTGMNNRLSLDTVVAREISRSERHGSALSIMLIDVDHFKQVNDQHGHDAGDRALKTIARLINEVIRDEDTAFRFGGEEFLVLLPVARADQACGVAERLRKAIEDSDFGLGHQRLKMTASIGVSEFRSGIEGWRSSLKMADDALYQAKKRGRNQVVGPQDLSDLAPEEAGAVWPSRSAAH
ncbi:MAG: diguanylate cyclase [Wenzhouxiangella sp.]